MGLLPLALQELVEVQVVVEGRPRVPLCGLPGGNNLIHLRDPELARRLELPVSFLDVEVVDALLVFQVEDVGQPLLAEQDFLLSPVSVDGLGEIVDEPPSSRAASFRAP